MKFRALVEQIDSLMNEAESFLNEGKIEEARAKREEAESLQNKLEEARLENANLEAMKEKTIPVNLSDESINLIGGKTLEIFNATDIQAMDRMDLVASDTYRIGYLKNLQGKELNQLENAAVSAASVIPTQTMDKIIEKLEQTTVIYSKVSVSSFPNKLSIPRENAKNDASWIAMSAASTDSEDSFDYVTLGANKLIKTIEIEADVMSMSIAVFESFIVNALAKKLAKAIENAIIKGTGTNQPTGLTEAGEITNTGTFTKAGMTYGDLMTIIADLPTSYNQNAVIVVPRALFFTDIMGMVDLDGRPVVHVDVESPSRFNILGYPVILHDMMPADTLIFGDLSYYQFNWAKPVEISSDNSVGFRSGSTVYRGLALADGKIVLPEAFTLYTRALA